MRLYTYLPKDNTAATDGLLSTALSADGYKKYRGRTGKSSKDDVLREIDAWEPEWTRSMALSALTEPIPSSAAPRFREFADAHRLYSFDTKDLIRRRILRHVRLARTMKGGGSDEVKAPKPHRINWNGKPGSYLFSGIPHYFVETRDGKVPADLVREEKPISFPDDEIGELRKRSRIFTTRVSDDFGKYKEGDVVVAPWGSRFKVRRRVAIPSVDRHPFYDKLTASQIGEIGEYKDIAGLWLDKLQEKTAGSRIDIPEIYGGVKARYAELGYPVVGDRLVVSEQPTYTNGKSVPESVMRPNESGGNTQDDGTVRINPKYRSVMRHWKLKGSGRDFLRAIIGHELGHHIDRTVLSKEPGQSRRNSLLQALRSSKFHTVYTDSYGPGTDPRKRDKELLAEYLSSCANRHSGQEKSAGVKELVSSVSREFRHSPVWKARRLLSGIPLERAKIRHGAFASPDAAIPKIPGTARVYRGSSDGFADDLRRTGVMGTESGYSSRAKGIYGYRGFGLTSGESWDRLSQAQKDKITEEFRGTHLVTGSPDHAFAFYRGSGNRRLIHAYDLPAEEFDKLRWTTDGGQQRGVISHIANRLREGHSDVGKIPRIGAPANGHNMGEAVADKGVLSRGYAGSAERVVASSGLYNDDLRINRVFAKKSLARLARRMGLHKFTSGQYDMSTYAPVDNGILTYSPVDDAADRISRLDTRWGRRRTLLDRIVEVVSPTVQKSAGCRMYKQAQQEQKPAPVRGRVYYVNFPQHPVEVAGATGGGGTSVYDKAVSWVKQKANWSGKVPLGHAGVLIRDGQGRTKYYEYGRYPNGNVGYTSKANGGYFGNFVRRPVPDFGKMTDEEYVARLGKTFPGEPKIEMYGADSNDVGAAERYITGMAADRSRAPYSVGGNNCGSVARRAFDEGRGWTGTAAKALDFVGGFTPSHNAPSLGTSSVSYVRPAAPTPSAAAPKPPATAAPSKARAAAAPRAAGKAVAGRTVPTRAGRSRIYP